MSATLALRAPCFNDIGKSLLRRERSKFTLVTAKRTRNYAPLKVQTAFTSSIQALRKFDLLYLELM